MTTFGKIKREIEELYGVKAEFDNKGLVFSNGKVAYHIGYENQLLILTCDACKAKMTVDSVSSLMRAISRIF